MTDKTAADGLEVVMTYEGRCIIDCGDHGHQHVTMHKMIAAGSHLVTLSSAQAAVEAARSQGEQAKPLTMIEQVDAAMIATRSIYPPITRSQCELIIRAAAHGIGVKEQTA